MSKSDKVKPLRVPARTATNAMYFRLDDLRDNHLCCEDCWKLTPEGRDGAREIIAIMRVLLALSEGTPVLIDPEMKE